MCPDPINNPNQSIITVPQTRLERKLKNNHRVSKVLAVLTTLATVGIGVTTICASLVLIPWAIAAIPIVIALSLMVVCLISLKKNQRKTTQIKTFLQNKGILETQEIPPPLSLNNLASIVKNEDQKKLLFPLEDTSSMDPSAWFSSQKLSDFFSQEWSFFYSGSTGNLYKHPSGKMYLTLQAGNISTFQRKAGPSDIGAIVNSIPSNINPEQGTANIITTTAVSLESWEASKKGKTKFSEPKVSSKKQGEEDPSKEGLLTPSFLLQVSEPHAERYPDTFQAYSALISTYKSCFEKAQSLGVTILQIPPLSSSPFYGTPDRGWSNMTKFAFLAAITLFMQENPNSCLEDIILMSPDKFPGFSLPLS